MPGHEPGDEERWYPTGWLAAGLRWRLLRRLLRRIRPSWRYGLAVGEEGVTELWLGREPVTWGWDEVRVNTDWGHYGLRLGDTTVRLLWNAPAVVDLATTIGHRLCPEPDDAPVVAASAIEAWLEIEPDGCLVVPSNAGLRWFVVVLWLLVTGLFLVSMLRGLWGGFVAPWLFTTASAIGAWLATPAIVVSAQGLQCGRRRVAWHDVVSVTMVYPGNQLITTRGILNLPGSPEAERVARTVRRLLNSRTAGQTLPRMTDIPDAALSRAETLDVSAERGLSRPEEPS